MEYFLRAFINGAIWSNAALQTAQFVGKGPYLSRKLRVWSKAYIEDRENLPLSKSSQEWSNSRIEDEDLKEELRIHLQSLGKYVTASALVKYLAKPDIQLRYNLSQTISLKTAERWMMSCGFRWTTAQNGQYIDGHEREDVVDYRQNRFLPAWYALDSKTRKWSTIDVTQLDEEQTITGRHTVVWFHDESTFYAHDRRKKRWVHKDEKSTPQPKGQGLSLMVADFVSADYGWLRSRDGMQSARILFRAGKARDGYFSNDEIIRHAEKAMTILEKDYPDDDHVFVFDNATTHLKRADDAISARQMPKGCKDWGVNAPVRDAQGNLIRADSGKVMMQKVRIADGFHNGVPQEFYWPEGHEKAGLFKGMASILTERGFDVSKLKAQCKNFECAAGAMGCCCRRILYRQPDFANIESLLETTCKARGVQVIFLPKFHCELNFIEQCWGFAKRLYRGYPMSTKDSDLEQNVEKALDAVPLASMRRFAIRSSRFMDAYHKCLNGSQAAWAAKKYRGHRVLPSSILAELDEAKII
ncbi:hypothetical protein K503DRAFT_836237 [Rhizopogon vinicolor AM-OR11-026]|uniref:Uncharacterized protein n=1 Tax=Rhizopogon vinicolor AM-OR11-026 TaxID=1314800 RepID=A0A1B7MMM4_9AGAM|nr:hypothetical protein K503DRAFT_836237 [Rhizopogon vinicolor AM-OR11-026]